MDMNAAVLHRRHETLNRRIAIAAAFLAAGLLLGQVSLLKTMHPFGPALIAACFLAKRPESLFAAAGVLLSALIVQSGALHILTVSLLLCVALLAMRRHAQKHFAVLLVVFGAFMLSAVIYKSQDISTLMTAVLEAMIAVVMTYVIQTLIDIASVRRRRSVFTTEETVCLALGMLTIVCALGPLQIRGVYIANIVAMLITLGIAYAGGAAMGAGVGLALGTACCLAVGTEAATIGMLGVCGMAAGTVRTLKKPGVAVAFLLTSLLFVLAFYPYAVWPLVLIEAAGSVVLFVSVPHKVFSWLARFFDARVQKECEFALHTERFKSLTVDRLKEVSHVFAQTGELFAGQALKTIEKEKSIGNVVSIVAEGTCKDCVFKKSCWEKDFIGTYNVISSLFRTFEKKGGICRSDIDPAFAKKCFNTNGIISTAESVFGAYRLNLKWKKKIDESRMITGKQLKGVAQVVSDLGREMDTGFAFIEEVEQRVAASLDAAGVRAREVCAERSACGGMGVALRVKHGTPANQVIEKAVSSGCGVRMKRVSERVYAEGKLLTLRFEQARRFGVLTGVAMKAKGEVSGDSHSFQGLRDGRYMLMLCDGMGSGRSAQIESAAAVSLTENFYQAGFDDAIIFDTINRLLMLKGSEEMFTTADLCVLDLHSGSGKFTKIGAERSYVLRGSSIATVKPGALPMGIVEEVRPKSTQMMLEADDMIVMMSDGIADAMCSEPETFFADIPKVSAQEAADAILSKAMDGGVMRDDMTVMVTQMIEE